MHTIGVLDLFSLFGMMVSIFWQGWHRMRDRWHVRDRVTWILERKNYIISISYLYHIYIISISYLYHIYTISLLFLLYHLNPPFLQWKTEKCHLNPRFDVEYGPSAPYPSELTQYGGDILRVLWSQVQDVSLRHDDCVLENFAKGYMGCTQD